jgi:hypothetical protein
MNLGFIESSVGLDRLATEDEVRCAMSFSSAGAHELLGLCGDFNEMDSDSSGRACNLSEEIEWSIIVREMRATDCILKR